MTYNDRPLISASTILGMGMGGFVDGILFHQIFQLHNMLSNRVPKVNLVNMEINMFWDGIFHAFTWIMTAIGLWLFWRAMNRDKVPKQIKTFVGSLFLGWGLFNLIEGIIDHYVIQLHHVVENLGLSIFDLLFLASGVIMIIVGQRLIQAGRKGIQKSII
ncbi:MAG: DUF2243 domain-containing protein [Bdellovibrionia bacterium]